MRAQWPEQLQQGYLVRFSTGLESPADLIADLHQSAQAWLAVEGVA